MNDMAPDSENPGGVGPPQIKSAYQLRFFFQKQISLSRQQVRFLKLHPVVPKKIDLEEILKNCFASSEASEERRQELLEVAGKRLTDAGHVVSGPELYHPLYISKIGCP